MTIRPLPLFAAGLFALLLAGCNPSYNWRDYASPDAPYRVMFPAKPASFTREIDLDGMRVAMTMTAAEVDGATFAVGTGVAPDAARAQAALAAMRTALARNIGAGTAASPDAGSGADIDVRGMRKDMPVRLVGHFATQGTRFYQVVVIGPVDGVPAEQLEQFFTSFSPR